jgi:hypothetical protein
MNNYTFGSSLDVVRRLEKADTKECEGAVEANDV